MSVVLDDVIWTISVYNYLLRFKPSIHQLLLIEWLTDYKCFTPYQQYFGHITAGPTIIKVIFVNIYEHLCSFPCYIYILDSFLLKIHKDNTVLWLEVTNKSMYNALRSSSFVHLTKFNYVYIIYNMFITCMYYKMFVLRHKEIEKLNNCLWFLLSPYVLLLLLLLLLLLSSCCLELSWSEVS